ncbi:hypothetical protein CC85DRAFT_330405 [Cutaneotrichosporon oleaginosum]|uniref:Zinc-ribbon 15 domain-containing protein n=1 Tax=Cutaneotrichosporon oleaginosum TaxID=879819 RepID=A0A0J0XFM2_9TREE|nr:uncharacterized protein CC85DRAFT_330405 [Cutaneotrichosporon oleaginosum]KLT39872.1 hypothetical protein CC85DRAFT_330405 [Cutaneotrichosporon oleaginosum]TXT05469.1 hypothetical protein COLE_06789 [Cutaneotrichosporon oleaginosum]
MSSFGIFNGGKNPNAANSEVLDALTGETAPALPRWERKNFVDFAAPKRIVQQTGKQYGRICPSCGEPSVVGASQMRVLSLFWVVPVWPVGPQKEIWGCGRCGWRQDRKGGPEPKKQDLSEAAHPVLLDVETTKRAAEAIEGKALEPRPLPEMSEEPPKGPKE